eukprot:gene2635-5008_t
MTLLVVDLDEHSRFLELFASPVWLYNGVAGRNVWGNSAALELFGADAEEFKREQRNKEWSEEQQRVWEMLNTQLRNDVEPAAVPDVHQNPHCSHQQKPGALRLQSNVFTLCSQQHYKMYTRTPIAATSRKPGLYACIVMVSRYAASTPEPKLQLPSENLGPTWPYA